MKTATRVLRMSAVRGPLALLVIGLAGVIAPGAAPAASAIPAFRIGSNVSPSHLVPGDSSGLASYIVTATNIGSEATNGSAIEVVDTLPNGVTVDPSPSGQLRVPQLNDDTGNRAVESCMEPGPTVVRCIAANSVLPPGGRLILQIPVEVTAGASGVAENRFEVSGGGAATASGTESAPFDARTASFGFQSVEGQLSGATGGAFTQAGGHPYQFHIGFQTNSRLELESGQNQGQLPIALIKDVHVKLPKGFVVNPAATTIRCTEVQLEAEVGPLRDTECPLGSQVGLVHTTVTLGGLITNGISEPIYNMVPPPGSAAAFAFNADGLGIFVHLLGGVNSAGEYELTSTTEDVLEYGQVAGVSVDLWGNPSDPSHDFRRGVCSYSGGVFGPPQGCPTERFETALLTMPSSCSPDPLETAVSIDSRREAGAFVTGTAKSVDPEGNPVGVQRCSALDFEPTVTARATTSQGDSPSGLDVTVHQPQNESYKGLSPANLKDVKVTLPEGMALNPSAGTGLAACTNAQIGYQPIGSKIRFSGVPQTCPDAAKLGTLEVKTPLLEEKLPGTIFLAKPYENPFGNLTAIYLAIESPETGIIVKLAGKVEADPNTGQLTAIFTENPELPIEAIETHFFEGSRAALTTPLACGNYTTTTTLTPWSSPEGADAHPSDSFSTSAGCSISEAAAPKEVSFTAGTVNPLSGSYSPFVLRISRKDGTQHLTGIDTTLPEGLVGRLAGIPYCPESDIALAKSREAPEMGKVEQRSPSCPSASEIGTVTVTAGSGITPIPVSGHVYLAGPYKGAPLSLVTIVPAVAGPFDLGDVVTRVALEVGTYDARIHAVSDPLPTIIDGIPLDVRSIELSIDRSNFTLNPTSCEAKAIEGTVATQAGQSAPLENRFQVGECGRLGFKPSLKLTLSGNTRRTGHPALKAVVTYPKHGVYANIARAQVGLPHSEFLDQGNLNKVCRQADLQAGTCPQKSIYGHVKAWTPLLDKPLKGPVYLGVGFGYKLPALVAELNGQIRVLLKGKVDTTRQNGIRNTFEAVPDAPVERFVLEMKGGPKYGLLENSEDICKKTQKASVQFNAQNGKILNLQPKIKSTCKGGRKAKKQHGN